jgi:hypothetical protein
MPSLSDFGLAPEEPRPEPRRRRYVINDESGAYPLPREEYDPALDEEVELPGVSGSRAGLYFGIGVGLGIAILAVVGGLYFRGAIGGPRLSESPAPTPMSTATHEARFEAWSDRHALELARLAEVLLMQAALPTGTQVESPDIQVIEEPLSAPHPRPTPAPSTGESSDTSPLSNELDELERSLRPRGPTAPPRAQSNDQAPPETPMPPPAEPTAPAETSPPAEPAPPANPY